MNSDHLDKELQWFENHREELLKEHEGKWGVVYKQHLIGVYDSFAEAAQAGMVEARSERILVKRIVKDDEIEEPSVNLTLGLIDAPQSSEPLSKPQVS